MTLKNRNALREVRSGIDLTATPGYLPQPLPIVLSGAGGSLAVVGKL